MTYQRKPETEPRPGTTFRPLLGLIILIVLGTASYLASPLVVDWLGRTEYVLGRFGWRLLPISMPDWWGSLLSQVIVAVMLFVLSFTLAMILLFAVMQPPREEYDVDLSDVRAERRKMGRRR